MVASWSCWSASPRSYVCVFLCAQTHTQTPTWASAVENRICYRGWWLYTCARVPRGFRNRPCATLEFLSPLALNLHDSLGVWGGSRQRGMQLKWDRAEPLERCLRCWWERTSISPSLAKEVNLSSTLITFVSLTSISSANCLSCWSLSSAETGKAVQMSLENTFVCFCTSLTAKTWTYIYHL